MQNTGQGGEKKSYRVILLLVVGLAAFSSAMKELNQVHDLTLQTSHLIADWSDVVPPAKPVPPLVKVETFEHKPVQPPIPAADTLETKTIRLIHIQKRDGKQCSISSSLH